MSEPITHVARLIKVWLKTDSGRRDMLRRDWPELTDCLDAVTWRPDGKSTPIPEVDLLKRCEATHNPGVWPYTARCVLTADHPLLKDHIDGDGHEWRKQVSCDGCRTIERKYDELPPNDEEAFYTFRRAERAHRMECPNR